MIGAIPYAVFAPIINRISESVQSARAERGETEPPVYDTDLPNRQRFYAEAWRRGLDVKLALGAFVIQVFGMAPFSAFGVVLMFMALGAVLRSEREALVLALVYAFATPVLYRTGFLNHNLMLGHVAFLGFLTLWDPRDRDRLSTAWRFRIAGAAGGVCVLLDYSGVVAMAGLFLYGLARHRGLSSPRTALRQAVDYGTGALLPILLLFFYQWKSFGNPFLPGQHWMPPVQWIEEGYQGYGLPQVELLVSLLVDHKYGLFISCPLFLLALAYPFMRRKLERKLPDLEGVFVLLLAAAFWVFFSGSNYTRLQWNTGIRYLAPIFPFLFLPAALVLRGLTRRAAYSWVLFSGGIALCMAMYRNVAGDLGVLDPVARTFTGGFQLPILLTLSRMGGQYGSYWDNGVSPLPMFALLAALLFLIWKVRPRGA
jgi:hypothetical protein